MNQHQKVNDLLPLYVSGSLDETRRRIVESHLPVCAECRAGLDLWQGVSEEVVLINRKLAAPPDLAARALRQIGARRSRPPFYRRAWQLLLSQVPLMRREIWPASAAILALGLAIVFLVDFPVNVIPYLAPLVAAAGLAVIYSPEHDPAYELARSTPTSPRQILLARMTLVFGYNLLLTVIASLILLPFTPGQILGGLIVDWLAPMTFLSSAALLLSLLIGSGNAISVTYLAWLAKIFSDATAPGPGAGGFYPWIRPVLEAYLQLWANSTGLLLLSAILITLSLWLVGKPEGVHSRPLRA